MPRYLQYGNAPSVSGVSVDVAHAKAAAALAASTTANTRATNAESLAAAAAANAEAALTRRKGYLTAELTSIALSDDIDTIPFAGHSADDPGAAGTLQKVPVGGQVPDNGIIFATESPSFVFKRIYSGPIDVRWFGAKGDDSSSAVQTANVTAINAALAAGGARGQIALGAGTYYINDTISPPSSWIGSITGIGREHTRIEQSDSTKDILAWASAGDVQPSRIAHLDLRGGRDAISIHTANNDERVIIVEDVFIRQPVRCCVRTTGSNSTVLLLRGCVLETSATATAVETQADYTTLDHCWLAIRGEVAIINNAGGTLTLRNVCGVPMLTGGTSADCWVRNYGSVFAYDTRFGSEGGRGRTAIENHAGSWMTTVHVENCYCATSDYAYKFYKLPQQLVLRGNRGYNALGGADSCKGIWIASTAAVLVGMGGTFAAMAGESFDVAIDEGAWQTITFGTEATQAAALNIINTALGAAATASINGANIDITSATSGSTSRVRTRNVDAGVTSKLGIPQPSPYGDVGGPGQYCTWPVGPGLVDVTDEDLHWLPGTDGDATALAMLQARNRAGVAAEGSVKLTDVVLSRWAEDVFANITEVGCSHADDVAYDHCRGALKSREITSAADGAVHTSWDSYLTLQLAATPGQTYTAALDMVVVGTSPVRLHLGVADYTQEITLPPGHHVACLPYVARLGQYPAAYATLTMPDGAVVRLGRWRIFKGKRTVRGPNTTMVGASTDADPYVIYEIEHADGDLWINDDAAMAGYQGSVYSAEHWREYGPVSWSGSTELDVKGYDFAGWAALDANAAISVLPTGGSRGGYAAEIADTGSGGSDYGRIGSVAAVPIQPTTHRLRVTLNAKATVGTSLTVQLMMTGSSSGAEQLSSTTGTTKTLTTAWGACEFIFAPTHSDHTGAELWVYPTDADPTHVGTVIVERVRLFEDLTA